MKKKEEEEGQKEDGKDEEEEDGGKVTVTPRTISYLGLQSVAQVHIH